MYNNCTNAGQGGGISLHGFGTILINNTVISNNYGCHTGGLFCKSGSVAIVINSNIVDNSSCLHYGVLANSAGRVTLVNSIISNNDGVNELNITNSTSNISVINCNVRGGQNGVYNNWGTLNWNSSNIDVDPLFVI